MDKLVGLVYILVGIAFMVAAVLIELAWLGFCFGTVIVGVLMLIFTPLLLLAPFVITFGIGKSLLLAGVEMANVQ